MKKILFTLFACLPFFIFSAPTIQMMLSDLEVIKSTYQVKYAPAEWKKQYANWDLDEAASQAAEKIQQLEKPDVKEYQQIVKEFIQSMGDLHVSMNFFSTEFSVLLFSVKEVDQRCFINSVHKAFSKLYSSHLNIGDEVLAINNQPVIEALEGIMKLQNYNLENPTYRAIAARYLTIRTASRGLKAEEGKVTITVKRIGTGKVEDVEMEWLYLPERITNGFHGDNEPAKFTDSSFFRMDMCIPFYKQMLEERKAIAKATKFEDEEDALEFLGKRKSFVPILGDVIWESGKSSFFHAYIYQTKDWHRVGYVRIPSFSPVDPARAVNEFAMILSEFEDETEALVIDVVDNPGGYGLFMFAIASMLTDKPLTPPKFSETISQADVYTALILIDVLENVEYDFIAQWIFGDDLVGYPVNCDFVRSFVKHLHFVVDEWNSGRQVTGYDYLMGISKIKPHTFANYTQPIMILTNELSISCGDFFPAIMQDNKRALIFGAKTAGAGGSVELFSHPSIFGIASYSCTVSLAARVNNQPIEDLGVQPEVTYRVTSKDLQGQYKGYKDAVNQTLRKAFF